MTHQIAPFGLRMPDDLKNWVKKTAQNEGRSVNGFIVQVLRKNREANEKGA